MTEWEKFYASGFRKVRHPETFRAGIESLVKVRKLLKFTQSLIIPANLHHSESWIKNASFQPFPNPRMHVFTNSLLHQFTHSPIHFFTHFSTEKQLCLCRVETILF
jgi:hypothetical protein